MLILWLVRLSEGLTPGGGDDGGGGGGGGQVSR